MSDDERSTRGMTLEQTPSTRPGVQMPSVGDVLKLSGVAGAVMYGALFLGYRKYYTQLGIRPEDVGVSNTFILVRSIGFILLAGIGTAVATLLTAWFNRAMRGAWTWRQVTHIIAVWLAFVVVSTACLMLGDYQESWLPGLLAATALALGCIAMARFTYNSRHDRSIALAGLVVSVVTIILVPAIAAIVSAYTRAKSVDQGRPATPAIILGIPILDVSAEEVHVNWICQNPRPGMFHQDRDNVLRGLFVGETSSSYYIRVLDDSNHSAAEIVKLPQSCTILTQFDIS